jgi:sugar phosphate isomerase/epimerase
MTSITRREWHKVMAGGLAGALVRPWTAEGAWRSGTGGSGLIDSTIQGVQIGVQSYSFRDRPLDKAIEGMVTAGIGSCELWQDHIERDAAPGLKPDSPEQREALRKWRLTVPLDHFRGVREKFDKAGVTLTAYNLSFRDDYTDEEIARGFEMAKALGVKVITASSNVSTAKRVDPAAQKAGITVGFHNHSNIKPNEFATPDDFASAMKGASPRIAMNLDIGHFTAANFDAVSFLEQHHDHIVSLHIKDRKRNQGPNVVFGEGDSPIVPVLRLLRDRKWAIPANIEYEYKGGDTVEEVRRCFEYCKRALEAKGSE